MIKPLPCIFSLVLIFPSGFLAGVSAQTTPVSDFQQAQRLNTKPAIDFVENMGQVADKAGNAHPEIRYIASSNNIDVYFTTQGISYVFNKFTKKDSDVSEATGKKVAENGKDHEDHFKLEQHVMTMKWIGADPDVDIVAENETGEYSNFYLPQCPHGITNVPHYTKLTYRELFPHIDVVYYITGAQIEYDLVIRPGGDPEDIQYSYNGAREMSITKAGSLQVSNSAGYIEESAPYTYQKINGEVIPVACSYEKSGSSIRLKTTSYNKEYPLVIDPVLSLVWSTFYGGSKSDIGQKVVTDNLNNVYLLGSSAAATGGSFAPCLSDGTAYFDTTGDGVTDIFIVKFNSAGIRQWATYMGGSGADAVGSACVDLANDLFITGQTASTTVGYPLCAVDNNNGFPMCDPGGGAYFDSTVNGTKDIYLIKLDATGVLRWSTFFGSSNNYDNSKAIATDIAGNLYLTGQTQPCSASNNLCGVPGNGGFPLCNPGGGAYYDDTHNGGWDGIIAKFSNSGVLRWSTFYGGNVDEYFYDIKVNGAYVYLTGLTSSTIMGNVACGVPTNSGIPLCDEGGGAYYDNTAGGVNGDALIMKFDTSGVLKWSTCFGGTTSGEQGLHPGLAFDHLGNMFACGYTHNYGTNDFPTKNPGGSAYYDSTLSGSYNAYLAKFNSADSLVWNTLIGNNTEDGIAVAVDGSNNVFTLVYSSNSVSGPADCSVPTNGFPFCNSASAGYFDTTISGNNFFLTLFDNAGVMKWSSVFGGAGPDQAQSLAIDNNNDIYIGGTTRTTLSSTTLCGVPADNNFPTCDPAGGAYYQPVFGGSLDDCFIMKISNYTVLPVELLDFTAAQMNNQYVLTNWTTTAEINNDYFIVDRSKDLQKWEEVGKVKGAGNSSVKNEYAFTDKNPFAGTSYYRLKQVDFNGDSEYFGPVPVRLDGIEITTIYPSPAGDHISYSVVSSLEGNVTLTVLDMLGKKVIYKTEMIHVGENKFSLSLNGISEGYYLLRLEETNGNNRTQKQFAVR